MNKCENLDDLFVFQIHYESELINEFLSLKNEVKEILKGRVSVCQCYQTNNDNIFLLGTENTVQEQLTLFLKNKLVKIIQNFYKKNYIQKNINNLNKLEQYENIFISIMMHFDEENDYEEIESKIEIKDCIFLKEFYYFRLQKLQQKWAEICALTNENSHFFDSYSLLFELMRFLLSNVKIKNEIIKIKCHKNCIEIYNQNDKIIQKYIVKNENLVSDENKLVFSIKEQKNSQKNGVNYEANNVVSLIANENYKNKIINDVLINKKFNLLSQEVKDKKVGVLDKQINDDKDDFLRKINCKNVSDTKEFCNKNFNNFDVENISNSNKIDKNNINSNIVSDLIDNLPNMIYIYNKELMNNQLYNMINALFFNKIKILV